MKLLTLISIFFLFAFSNPKVSPEDFDYKLSDIALKFRQVIMDEESCGNLKEEAEELVYEISDEIKKEYNYSSSEIASLKKLKIEAEALEVYIACVGACGEDITSIDAFLLANSRVGANISFIVKDKFCVDIVSVTISNYVVYLAWNNSTKNFKVAYKWKTPNGSNSGEGTMGNAKKCVRYLFSNRKNPSLKSIVFFAITCKEIPSIF